MYLCDHHTNKNPFRDGGLYLFACYNTSVTSILNIVLFRWPVVEWVKGAVKAKDSIIARYYSLQSLCNQHSKHPLQVAGEGVVRRGKAINVSNVQVYTGFKTGLARAK